MLEALLLAFSGPGEGFMYAIVAVLALSLTVTLERAWLLGWRWRTVARPAGGWSQLSAGSEASHPLGELLRAGEELEDPEARWGAMSARATRLSESLERRIHWLGACGNIATMLGLLGTIHGLTLAFSSLGDPSAAERALRLSEGVAAAMSTTALGLLVALPSLASQAWLEGLLRRRLSELEAAAGEHWSETLEGPSEV